jgi:hypothetical protein
MLKKAVLASALAAVVFIPSLASAGQNAYANLTCTGGTTGSCTATAQSGGPGASGAATEFNWKGTNITVTATGPNTATYSCNPYLKSYGTGAIKAFTGQDPTGIEPLSASVYISCREPNNGGTNGSIGT